MGGRPWRKEELDYAVKVLRNSASQTEAVKHIAKHLKRPSVLQMSNLALVFAKKGLDHPSAYLPKYEFDAAAIPDPVTRKRAKEDEGRLKREHRELVERLEEAEARQTVLDSLKQTPVAPRVMAREKKSGLREGTAVALASDWHVEEVVYAAAVADRNEYNLKIADARAREFFKRTRSLVEFSRGSWKVRDLVLWLGGDLMTGFIHPELEESNELSPVETLIWLRQRLVEGIDYLLQDRQLERLYVPCSYGNHGRIHQKKRLKTGARNSFEWLLYQWLATHYESNKRILFDASQSAHQYVELYPGMPGGGCLHLHHGDEVNYGGGVGGISIPLNKRVPRWTNVRPSRWHAIGHFHQFLDLGHTVINGSLIGYTEYAFSIGADFEPPRQAFFLVDSRRGKCLTAPIWVEGK